MLQEKEEQLLKKRMIELAGLCYQRDIQTSTGFLSLNEQTIFHSIEKTLPPVRTCLTGGFEGAERKLLCFLASYDDEEFGLPIAVLEQFFNHIHGMSVGSINNDSIRTGIHQSLHTIQRLHLLPVF